MDQHYENQCSRFDLLQKSKTNYKKDGEARKTRQYLEKRILYIESIWEEFEESDNEMKEQFFDQTNNHQYWKERESVKQFYQKYRAELEAKMRQDTNYLTPKASTSNPETIPTITPANAATTSYKPTNTGVQNVQASDANVNKSTSNNNLPNVDSDQARRLKAQEIKIRLCYRLMAEAVQLVEAEGSLDQLQYKLRQLDTRINQIEELHEDILVASSPEEESTLAYYTNDDYAVLITNFEALRPKITERLTKLKPNDKEQHDVKLKRIEVPQFHGDTLQWASFYDLFRKIVHENNKISSTIKMHQLKTSVLGPAGRIISHLEATGDNYNDAWKLLVNRYQNKRMLASNHVNAILNFPTMYAESAAAIKSLHDLLTESLHAIKNLGILTVSWNYIVIPIVTKKLDNETLRLLEMSIPDPKEMPTLEDFLHFLERRFQALEATKAKVMVRNAVPTTPTRARTYHVQISTNCIICKQNHELMHCNIFQKKAPMERSKFIADHQLCRQCFKDSHYECPSAIRCLVCKGNHNTLLHSNNTPGHMGAKNKNNNSSKVEKDDRYKVTTHLVNQYEQPTSTLLATAMVLVPIGKEHSKLLRVLIDPGSQSSFITEEASKQIQQSTRKTHVEIGGINGSEITTATKIVTFNVKARFSSSFSMAVQALVLPNITRHLPEQNFDNRKWDHLNNLIWADPNYNQPNKIDILLGADYYPNILMNQVVKGHQGEPIAQQTELGWIIFGQTSTNRPSRIESMVTLSDVENQLKRFWEIEEIQPKKLMTEEEIECEQHYQQNYRRDTDGRYIVRFPFKEKLLSLGASKQRALARLIQLERRFGIANEFASQYRECLDGYKTQGHLIESKESDSNEYYIPHHAVLKTTSTTTKLRVVFDASAKTSNNISLNQMQLVGPKLQDDLMTILLRWRKYKIAYTADIEQMYRQIKVHPDDQQYQKILWRNSPSEPAKSYQLTTVTFGMTCAPYLAIRTLQQLAIDEEKNFPIAAQLAKSDFYVDDLLSGNDNLEEAQKAQGQLIKLLKTGGFNLRKWASNSPQLLENINSESRAIEPIILGDEAIKTLGLSWNPGTDTFQFKVNLNNKEKMTKRKMLSESSKLFDPLGWLSPTLVKAKILMQTLWISGATWDQKLPEDLENKCQQYYVSLPKLEEIKIPRWIQFNTMTPGELHGFCDASETAYAAVVYFYNRSSKKATLLTSKTKVAPIATKLTLPRLELCGASLLAHLMNRIQHDMKLDGTPTYYWTDSMIVLGWVKNKPHKFKTFVANRISEIQKLTNPTHWFHIKSDDNPADCASRGIDADQLIKHKLWWNGPETVFDKATQLVPVLMETIPIQLELKQKIVGTTTVTLNDAINQLYVKYSKFNKIKRVVVYVMRFIKNCQKKEVPKTITPTAQEIKQATHLLIKNAQEIHFKNEILDLINNKELSKKSTIRSLSPFLREEVLRVGGRMHNTTLWTDGEKHPIIIPKEHSIAKLLIQEAHEQTMHGGTQLTLAHLRTQYWIIHGQKMTRNFISKCIKCHRFNTKVRTQLMGNLPAARITPGRPFLKTGVDYAGPLLIRTTKGRGYKAYKGYLAIFVCMSTKAIHIEPVSDLTTEAFIAAYKRFTARRGLCCDLYSDNGTNFVGARNQLEREMTALLQKTSEEVAHLLADDGTTWHFIPPASPHFGGLWEAAVKSVKKHLIKVIGEATLTFEELATVTSQVEACLNSRPLMPMTADPTDITFLTPGHFLIGTSLRSIPQDVIENKNIHNGISRWRLIEKINQDFWKRWQSEYLNQLQHRRKWSTTQPNLKIGDLVLIKDDNTPPLKWLTGRVVDVHSGKDAKIRVVSLRGPGRILIKRPIHKLSPLPLDKENAHPTTQQLQPQPRPQLRIQPNRKVKQLRVHHMHTKRRRSTTIPLVLLIMGMIQGLCTAANSLTHIEPLPPDAGIYFYNSGTVNLMSLQWTIIINYNLTGYWENIRSINTYINHLNGSCQIGWEADSRLKMCDVIIQQLHEQMKEITSQNDLLRTTNKEHIRRKRDIGDTVGYILGDAFGIMNQRDATHIENQLNKAETNEEYLLKLIQNQTSIIDATTNVFKHEKELNDKHFRAMIKQFLYLDKRTTKLAADSDHYDRVQSIIAFTIQIMLIMRRIAENQRVIIDVILSSHQGHIHPALLTPQQLKNEIQKIHQYAPSTMRVPEGDYDNDLGYIYKLLTVQTRVTENNILFSLKLPLAYTQLYQLYEIIPIPMLVNGELQSIKSSTKYLIIDLHREHYTRLTSRELQRCVQLKTNGFLCNISPIYNTHSQNLPCEINLLKHKESKPENCIITVINQTDYWTQLSTNQWIFAVTKPKTVDLICDHQVTTMKLERSGILTLDQKCILKHEEFYLTTIEEKIHIINSSFTAAVKISNEESHYQSSTETTQITYDEDNDQQVAQELTNLRKAIIQQKTNEERLPESIENTSYGHHVHYIITYTFLTIIIILIGAYACQRRRRRGLPEVPLPQQPVPRPRALNLIAPQYVHAQDA